VANTYSNLFYHLIFSTKKRTPFIASDIEQRLWAYVGGIARKRGMTAVQVGGIEDHLHVLIMTKPTVAPSQAAQWLKAESSKWIHETFEGMRSFAWQDGYGVFTVTKSMVPGVIEYIKGQRQHHSTQTFEEEYLSLLKLNEIDYDERYVFD
jgi:putative transposase